MTAPPQDREASPTPILKKDFAAQMGIARSRVTQLVQAGMPAEPDGRIDEAKARAWCEENQVGRKQKRSSALARLRVEIERERLRRLRLDNAVREGGLVQREEVRRLIVAFRKAERDAWMTWASRMAPTLATELQADPRAVFALLEVAVRQHLRELAGTPVGGPEMAAEP